MHSKSLWFIAPSPIFFLMGGIIFLVSLFLGIQLPIAIAIGVAIGLLTVVLLLGFSKTLLARLAHASPIHPKKDARLLVKINYLCLVHGFEKPNICIIKSRKLLALAYGLNKKNATIALSLGTKNRLDPVQLEAVLTHELTRIRQGLTSRETYAAILLSLPFGRLFDGLYESLIDADTVMDVDIKGMELTRYPPGIINALTQMSDTEDQNRIIDALSITRYGNERVSALREYWASNT